ncbi:hypothetical protein [uncultured Fusobacterium sp.]|jgi:hypothetical protein|uniref:hypothetical protein n=1 Tax=uncultured Fusobacterium sp. TaxID=159267 RepID=UPI0025FD8473|nr:hypothetical protein [uncultured Fusobacterium sp.]
MEYILKNVDITEKTMGNKWFLKSNFGRIYINSCIKDYELITPNKLRIGTNTISLPEKTQYGNTTYIHSALRDFNVGVLLTYFNVTDYFLERLIRENINCSFENIHFLKDIPLSDIDKYSLLKPVYHRYISTKKNKPSVLRKIEDNLKKRNKESYNIDYDKMVLYDVPCIIGESKLRILDNLLIDISELLNISVNERNISCVFNCLSLGVSKFDRVEIILEKVSNLYSGNLLYGKQIKEIKLIKI